MQQLRAHLPTKRNLFRTSLSLLAAMVVLTLLPAGAEAKVPGIEGYPGYHPQTRCNPKPKPGTVELANYLVRHYRGSGSLGIARSCGASGVSEHKEGRAFDWRLDANSRRDRHYAADFLHRLRKRDPAGRPAALARRMGVMYVIWNDRIYSSTHHYQARRYLNAGCRSLRRCSKSLRHRNHMHISLTRAAARKKTSWYAGHGAAPKPKATKHKVHKAKPKRPKAKAHHGKAKRAKAKAHHGKAKRAKAAARKARQHARKKQHARHKPRAHQSRGHSHRSHHKAHPRKARNHAHARHHKRKHQARHHKRHHRRHKRR